MTDGRTRRKAVAGDQADSLSMRDRLPVRRELPLSSDARAALGSAASPVRGSPCIADIARAANAWRASDHRLVLRWAGGSVQLEEFHGRAAHPRVRARSAPRPRRTGVEGRWSPSRWALPCRFGSGSGSVLGCRCARRRCDRRSTARRARHRRCSAPRSRSRWHPSGRCSTTCVPLTKNRRVVPS